MARKGLLDKLARREYQGQRGRKGRKALLAPGGKPARKVRPDRQGHRARRERYLFLRCRKQATFRGQTAED